jgi:crotonobetainyl-CoA:carnitine CoA-transferase CaiB-like acyl-CoA transferase
VASRIANVDDLYTIVAETLLTKTTEEWLRIFDQIDVPAARLREPDEVIEDPDGLLTGLFSFEDHPTEGRVRTMAHPVRYANRRPPPIRLAPGLGEHTDQVLGDSDGPFGSRSRP